MGGLAPGMRRKGKYNTAHTVRHCCVGRYHAVPLAEGDDASGDRVAYCCGRVIRGSRCLGHNYSHSSRCSGCKPGRHHGDGGAKALKKVPGNCAHHDWLRVVKEARAAERGLDEGVSFHLLSATRSKALATRTDVAIVETSHEEAEGEIIVDASPPVVSLPASPRMRRRGARFVTRFCQCCNPSSRKRSNSNDSNSDWTLVAESDWAVV